MAEAICEANATVVELEFIFNWSCVRGKETFLGDLQLIEEVELVVVLSIRQMNGHRTRATLKIIAFLTPPI